MTANRHCSTRHFSRVHLYERHRDFVVDAKKKVVEALRMKNGPEAPNAVGQNSCVIARPVLLPMHPTPAYDSACCRRGVIHHCLCPAPPATAFPVPALRTTEARKCPAAARTNNNTRPLHRVFTFLTFVVYYLQLIDIKTIYTTTMLSITRQWVLASSQASVQLYLRSATHQQLTIPP